MDEATRVRRVNSNLAQTFVVQLIHQTDGEITVEYMPIDANLLVSLAFNKISDDTAFLAVSGTTPFSTEEASFVLEIN